MVEYVEAQKPICDTEVEFLLKLLFYFPFSLFYVKHKYNKHSIMHTGQTDSSRLKMKKQIHYAQVAS